MKFHLWFTYILIGTMLEISTPAGLDIGPTTTCWANVRFSARSSFKIHHPAVWWSIMCANQMLDFIDVVSISNVRPRATAESTSPLSVSWFSIWLFSFFICVFPSDPARSRSNEMRGAGKGGDPSDHTHTHTPNADERLHPSKTIKEFLFLSLIRFFFLSLLVRFPDHFGWTRSWQEMDRPNHRPLDRTVFFFDSSGLALVELFTSSRPAGWRVFE